MGQSVGRPYAALVNGDILIIRTWTYPGEKVVQRRTDTEYVGALVYIGAVDPHKSADIDVREQPVQWDPELLRRRVAEGSAQHLGRAVEHQGYIEVNQTDVVAAVEHDIGRLYVAVDYRRILAVEVLDGTAQLNGIAPHLRSSEFPAGFDHGIHVSTVHEIHDGVGLPVLLDKIQHLGQVGVLQLLQQVDFLPGIRRGLPDVLQLLDDNKFVQAFVQRFVDDSSAALPDLRQDLIHSSVLQYYPPMRSRAPYIMTQSVPVTLLHC